MKCLVTAGPTYEPLDEVRRLTNFSTGRLGAELADFLAKKGHEVVLMRGSQSTFCGSTQAQVTEVFTTTTDLEHRLKARAKDTVNAVFHAAAVSDFCFGRIWEKDAGEQLVEIHTGKLTSRAGPLLAELLPTTKLIHALRGWFPQACVVGWKYEIDGSKASTLDKARQQIADHQTHACVANGPAHGPGFSLVCDNGLTLDCQDRLELFAALEKLAQDFRPSP
jgi:phosphopantothenate---cysteine ligase (CTP)